MKLSRISFLFLLLLLFLPSIAFAQSAAEKSWQSFWTQFSSAVKTKNRSAIKKLMASKIQFSDGDVPPNTAIKYLDNANGELWQQVKESVAKGTKAYDSGNKKATRVTKDDVLVFEFSKNGGWRWVGFMGD